MRERPIIFNAEMVRAILEGRKTQTRRPIKVQPTVKVAQTCTVIDTTGDSGNIGKYFWGYYNNVGSINQDGPYFSCPYGVVGDRLWVRETCLMLPDRHSPDGFEVMYQDNPDYDTCYPMKTDKSRLGWKVCPSIHMPRFASRITRENSEIRIERLEDITEEGARAEGFESREAFLFAYRSIYGLSKDANPFLWAITFKVIGEASK